MTMRKAVSILLALLLTLAFPSCSKVADEPEKVMEKEAEVLVKPSEPEPVIIESVPEPEPEPEPEPYPQNELRDKAQLSEEFKYLEGLGTEQVLWGPGTNYGADGRPVACVQLQQKYGSMGAHFVRMEEESKGKIYLTFDEGYENGFTAPILDTLKGKGVSAVFFVTLPYVKSCPDLVKRMIDEGHIVGNHTSGHPNMTTITAEEGYDDVAKLHNYVKENFGYSMYLFRFPEGAFSEQNLGLIRSMGYTPVFWSFAYKDWDPESQMDEETAYGKVMNSLHDGEIVLLHAVSETNSKILGKYIDAVREKGYTFEKYKV